MVLERKMFSNNKICNKGIELKKINDYEKLKSELNLTENDIQNHRKWASSGSEYYYYKILDNYNDFIGEKLAKHMNLESAHYEIGKLDNNYVLASKNFNISNQKYLNAFDLIKDEMCYKSNIDKLIYLESKYGNEVVLDILKMTSLDLFMRQVDRVPLNYVFENNNGNIRLGPLYDYSFSFFNDDRYRYLNYILYFDFTSNNIKSEVERICSIYPEFYKYLCNLYNINLNNLINDILIENDLNYNSKINEDYKIENEISHKMLKKIL